MVSPFDKYFSEKSEKDIILEDNSNEKQENNASAEKKYQPTPEINQKQEETKKEIKDLKYIKTPYKIRAWTAKKI